MSRKISYNSTGGSARVVQRALRSVICLAAVAAVTFVAYRIIPVNATTAGFGYLLLVLSVASVWGFLEASLTATASMAVFNRYFFEPIGTFRIEDPRNWAAVFSFFATALIASRLSEKARRRALDAVERQKDIERLYTFSRAVLLTGSDESIQSHLIRKLADTFDLSAATLYDRRAGEFYRAGTSEFEGLDDQLRAAALEGKSFTDVTAHRTITAVRLGAEPIASLAMQGTSMPESVVQGIANLVAIGLEQARSQELSRQIEVARQSEQLRTTLIDAMAHELKTPLTLIKGATSAVLAAGERLSDSAREQLTIADEEAEHLRRLLDDAIEMARLDTARIEIHLERAEIGGLVCEVLASMKTDIDTRPVKVLADESAPRAAEVDCRLVKLALKQLLDNALKYSPPDSSVEVRIRGDDQMLNIEITDYGPGIPKNERQRVFERFYRGESARKLIPGSGLGLTIAHSIAEAHCGELTVTSQPGETTFRMTLPVNGRGGKRS